MKTPISLMFVLTICLMQVTFAAYLRKVNNPTKQSNIISFIKLIDQILYHINLSLVLLSHYTIILAQIKQDQSVQYQNVDLDSSIQSNSLNFMDVQPQFQLVDASSDPTILKISNNQLDSQSLKPFSDYQEYDETFINNLETEINKEQQIEKNIKKDNDILNEKQEELDKENKALQEIQDKNMIATGQITYEEVAERERLLHEQMQQLTFQRTQLSQEQLEEEQDMNQLQNQEQSLKMLPAGITKEYLFNMMPIEQEILINPPELEQFDNDISKLALSKSDIEKEMGFSYSPKDNEVEDPSQLSDQQVDNMKKQRQKEDLEVKKLVTEETKNNDSNDNDNNENENKDSQSIKQRDPNLPRVKNAHVDQYQQNDNGPQYVENNEGF